MRTPSGELHVVYFKTEQIVASIQPKDYWDDKRHWEIKNNIDTLEFRVFDNTRYSSTLMQQNLVLKEVRDGRIVPYVITEIEKESDDRSVIAYASGEWVQLAKAGIIPPQKLEGKTVIEMVDIALAGTKWKKGNLEYTSFRSMTIDEFIDPLSFLKKIASLFELEIQYRAEVVGSQVVGRYVDMVKKRGRETGKEVTLGKDLMGIKRIENSQNICTALVGFVKKEGDTIITVESINNGFPYIVDNDAFQRWNERGQHKFGFYTPETEEDITPQRLMTLMNTELKKRVNTSVSYEVEAQSIGRVFGLAHELINEGDTIRIKDTGFTLKLYLEARAIAGDESYKNPLQDKYVFGDYREIVDPNEELRKLYNKILASLGNKANKELLEQLEKLAEEAKKQSEQAVEESQTAKDISEKLKENIENNMVDIIEAKNPPTTGLKANKTLWRDISNGKPGILKIWTGVEWESVVPDVEGIKRDLELTNEAVSSKISGKQMEDYIGGLGSTNILVNSAFEDREINTSTGIITDRTPSLSKWVATTSVGTSVTPTTDKRHDGYNSVKIQANGLVTNVWTGVSQKTAVTSGAGKLVLSAWVFTDNKDNLDQDGDLEIKFLNGSTIVTTINVNLKDKLNNGVWTFIYGTADVPSSAVTNADVRIGIRKNGLIWVSQPQFQQGEKPSSFMENQKDYTNYDQLVDEIAKKVATSEFDSKITSVQTTINQQSDRIDLKAEKKDIYNKIESDGRYGDKAIVERHESSISLLTDEISLRVKDGDIASAINQTAQAVLIQATKIYLDGFIEAKHLKAQELVGVTIKTAPNGNQRYVKLNQQNIELYDRDTARAEFRFFNRSDGTAINPTLTLGRSVSGGIVGALNITQWTPINAQGVDNYQNAQATIGMVEQYNPITNEFTYGSRINFFQNGLMAIKSTNSHNYSNNNGTFNFKNTGKTTGNQMMLSDNNIDADLRLAFIRIRASHATGYQSYLQLVPTGENTPTAGLQLGNLSYTSLTNRSSRSIKSNIRDLEIDSLEKIMSLKVRQYNFKSDVEKLYQMRKEAVGTSQVFTTRDIPLQYGLVLEDTDETFVSDLKDGINLYTLVTLNVDATQKIKLTQDDHEEEINNLKSKVASQDDEIADLKLQVAGPFYFAKRSEKMDRIDVLLKAFIATFGGFCGYFLGGWDATLKILVTMAVIDYLTGMIAAGYNGELKSKVGFKGIAKKVVLFLLVGAAAQLDSVLGSNSAIREATIFFFMGNELLSLLENAGRMGIPLPSALTNAVEILGGKPKQEEKKGEDA